MITKNTVLILGAGASRPYGFPSGDELARKLLRPTRKTLRLLREIGLSMGDFRSFRDAFTKFDQGSVDAFLEHRHAEFGEIGKLLIAASLIECEEPLELSSSTGEREGKWYRTLFCDYLLRQDSDRSIEAFKQNNLTVLTYNYDRSLEQWLVNQFTSLWRLQEDDALDLLAHLPIIHLHGQLGELCPDEPDNPLPESLKLRPYNTSLSTDSLKTGAAGIRIIHEEPKGDEFRRAGEALREAEAVVFFGFGYHPTNVQRLRLRDHCVNRLNVREGQSRSAQLHGTTYGLTESEVAQNVRPLFRDASNPQLTSKDALTFLREHHAVLLEKNARVRFSTQ